MSREIRKAAVLGAGTMGSRIAAHLGNAGIDCLLLDLPSEGDSPAARSAVAAKALKGLGKSRPPAFFTAEAAKHIRIGNFEDDFERLADAEWIIEAVIEKYEPKRALLEKIDGIRQPGALISSNTSGLPIAGLAAGLSDDFRRHWLGTHFFNPPRHMRLLELIPTPDTDPAVTAFVADFCDRQLGKVIVHAHDRPNFIANRIFLFSVMHAVKTMLEQGLTIEQVDALSGPLIGRPRMATFRLADFTGVDVCLLVAGNLYELIPDDEQREVYQPPEFLKRMAAEGMLGDKAGRGFYKKDPAAPGGRLALDLESFDYREMRQPEWPSLSEAQAIPDLGSRITRMIEADDAAGRFLWTTLSELFLYAAARVPEVCDDLVAIDTTMKAGFNWQAGIFEIWDALGLEKTTERMRADGKSLPPLVERALGTAEKSFYARLDGNRTYVDLESGQRRKVPVPAGVLQLEALRAGSSAVHANAAASLWDIGDGVALLEIHSKANSLDQDVFAMLAAALDSAERDFEGLVVGATGENFSVGANLKMILGLSSEGRWEQIDQSIADVQALIRRIRRCSKPVAGAVFGRTLAGGCEIALRCDHVQAAAETYMGLVEVSVGLVPAAGGCAEMMRRATAGLDDNDSAERETLGVFEMIGAAKVSNSAAEARGMSFLGPSDGITMNRDRLLADAKRAVMARAQAGYEPPQDSDILVGGRGVRASLELRAWMMQQAMWASEHDLLVGKKLAGILAGGDLTQPSFVSEDYLLGLEREAFLSLCGESKTQQRIEHILKTGRPLRN